MEDIELLLLKEFEQQVRKNFQREAVCAFDLSISYGELDYKSTLLANYLYNMELDNNKVFGIYDNGSTNHFIAMIACLKVGKPFINLDVRAPQNYNSEILSQLKISALIVGSSENVGNFSNNYRILNVEEILKNPLSQLPSYHHFPSKFAYVVATSGTTGTPKLVVKTLEALNVSFEQIKQSLPFLFVGAIQQTAPLHYAFGLDQSLIFLCAGVTICIDAQEDYVNLKHYYHCIEKHQTQTIFWASPVLKLLSRQPQLFKGLPSCLKYIVVGGEPLIVSAAFLFELRNREIILLNNYGCTEMGTMFFTTVAIPLLEIQEYNRIPIGNPLFGLEVALSSDSLNDKGELLIYTKRIFNNYYNDDILMNSKVSLSPNKNGKVCFFTGDIAERINGNYYIVGRLDNCVNVRGFRVEIESIERHISQIIKGLDCCVIPQKNEYDETTLICFYQEGFKNTPQILKELEEVLPSYMIPSRFFSMLHIPKLNNGKIDRKKLLHFFETESKQSSCKYDINNLEQRIKNLLEEMLKYRLSSDFREHTFDELGLDSLSFVDFVCKVEFSEKIVIDDEVIVNKKLRTVNDLINLLESKK